MAINLVLVHGFLGFKRLWGMEYFKGVARHLKSIDPAIQILVPTLDPDASIENRARQLDSLITKWRRRNQLKNKLHIVAHSMGGLDARFLISSPKFNGFRWVRSLTTLGTPHWGTPVAEMVLSVFKNSASQNPRGLFERPKNQSKLMNSAFKGHPHITYLLDLLFPFDGGILDMTPKAMEQFNRTNPNKRGVAYFSYAGISGPTEKDKLTPILIPFQRQFKNSSHPKAGGKNDGLVSVTSAKGRGCGKGTADFKFMGALTADHIDLIGHDWSISSRISKKFLGKTACFDHLKLYDEIFRRLRAL